MAEATNAPEVSSLEECKGCGRHLKKLLRHLASSTSCRNHYDFEKEKEERRKKTLNSSQRRSRENLSEEDKKNLQ